MADCHVLSCCAGGVLVMAGLNAGDGASGGSVCTSVCYDLELLSGGTVLCPPANGIKRKRGFHFINFASFFFSFGCIPPSTTHKESWNQLSRDDLFPSLFFEDELFTADIHC